MFDGSIGNGTDGEPFFCFVNAQTVVMINCIYIYFINRTLFFVRKCELHIKKSILSITDRKRKSDKGDSKVDFCGWRQSLKIIDVRCSTSLFLSIYLLPLLFHLFCSLFYFSQRKNFQENFFWGSCKNAKSC